MEKIAGLILTLHFHYNKAGQFPNICEKYSDLSLRFDLIFFLEKSDLELILPFFNILKLFACLKMARYIKIHSNVCTYMYNRVKFPTEHFDTNEM